MKPLEGAGSQPRGKPILFWIYTAGVKGERWKLRILASMEIKPYLEPKVASKLSILWVKDYNSLYGLSHFEFSFTCKGKIPHQYKGLYHYDYTAYYLWFPCRAEQCMIAYSFMSGTLVFFEKVLFSLAKFSICIFLILCTYSSPTCSFTPG